MWVRLPPRAPMFPISSELVDANEGARIVLLEGIFSIRISLLQILLAKVMIPGPIFSLLVHLFSIRVIHPTESDILACITVRNFWLPLRPGCYYYNDFHDPGGYLRCRATT